MQSSGIPVKMPVVWATNAPAGNTNQVPNASQIGIVNGAASFTDGFPPLTFLPGSSGGVPPFGKDFNGIFQQIVAWHQWFQAGGWGVVTYDASFATSGTFNVNGYPKGAILASATTPGKYFLNTAENNTVNPDTVGTNWQPFLLGNSGVVAAVYTRPQLTINNAGQVTAAASGAQPTRTILTTGSGNYNPQGNAPGGFTCTRLFVRFVGGGGGANAGNGTDTVFNGVHAKAGTGGSAGVGTAPGSGGAGGTGGTGTAYLRIPGQDGSIGGVSTTNFPSTVGGIGGSSPFFGGGGIGGVAATGSNGKTNTGGGAGGSGGGLQAGGGGGGGSGEYVELQITFPGSTLIAYTVGTGGSNAQAVGAAGIILIDEYYD